MQPESCDLDYIYEPLTPYRRAIMDFVALHVPEGADVLDIGCGAVGFYWALGYLGKVASVSFGDGNPEILGRLAARVDALTPEGLERDFGAWDWAGGAGYEEWLAALHGKIVSVAPVDALGEAGAVYGALVAVELFECAQDEDELARMAAFCAGSLAPGGRLVGCCLNFQEWTETLALLARERQAGPVNPDAAMLRGVLEKAGFAVTVMDTRETGMGKFPVCHLFCAEKPV